MHKVLLIGSTGFVGRNIAEILNPNCDLYVTTRRVAEKSQYKIYFDFSLTNSWEAVADLNPDIIINSAGYGVVKEEQDLEEMYNINYRFPSKFVDYLQRKDLKPFWIQIGTAFEYDLEQECLHEKSACVPFTHYGISKFMCSHFLQSNKNTLEYLILRPFAMFGPYESENKLLPFLIQSQKDKKEISLSSGEQQRDYFFVKDLAVYIKSILNTGLTQIKCQVVNLGSRNPKSLKEIAQELSSFMPDFEMRLWKWGDIPQRINENNVFFNSSTKAYDSGFELTDLSEALKQTVEYYFNQRK